MERQPAESVPSTLPALREALEAQLRELKTAQEALSARVAELDRRAITEAFRRLRRRHGAPPPARRLTT